MKAFIILSLVLGTAFARPGSSYGQSRVEVTLAPVVRRPYEAPPPIVRTTLAPAYEAPAPIVRTTLAPAYEAPAYGASKLSEKSEKILEPVHQIVRHNLESDHQGKYSLDMETSHGIKQSEQGQLRDVSASEGPVGVKTGSYSYTGPDKKVYTVNWVADENGFRATGDHLPTSPPIPEAIKASLLIPRLHESELDGPKGEGESPNPTLASYGSYAAPLAYKTPVTTAAPVILTPPVKVSTY
ncbi:unnamed protein product [Allacma fusca]|uniref:Endocuticle structural glycoprotein SgAbd-2 n=1 Tax=Allacma fusca TaxID=39272 RepID=A0A8J2K902_9HEXA|nr:unnamed protein product [Allacma fusca]